MIEKVQPEMLLIETSAVATNICVARGQRRKLKAQRNRRPESMIFVSLPV